MLSSQTTRVSRENSNRLIDPRKNGDAVQATYMCFLCLFKENAIMVVIPKGK
jgi:hypothetical protein